MQGFTLHLLMLAHGVQWSNIHEYPASPESVNMRMVLTMMAFDVLLYIVLSNFMRERQSQDRELRKPWTLIHKVNMYGLA